MDVREHDLPGVGKKFAVTTNDSDRLTIIIHNSGHREIYFFERGEDYPAYAVRMEDSEARKLGAILGGAFFQPVIAESMDVVFSQLSVEWMKTGSTSPLIGQSLLEARIRERTGASVIAILRGEKAIPNPQPEERIAAGDTLMVVGDREQVGRFGDLLRGPGRDG